VPHKILALKERPEYAHALKELIEPHGYKVLIAHTVEDAIEILHREPIDMVIAAVHLEVGSIFGLIREIRDDINLKNIPIVCLNINPGRCAVYFNDSLEVASRVLGADRFITMQDYDALELWKQIDGMLPVPKK
jgi:CheY-like chemotaxis protein